MSTLIPEEGENFDRSISSRAVMQFADQVRNGLPGRFVQIDYALDECPDKQDLLTIAQELRDLIKDALSVLEGEELASMIQEEVMMHLFRKPLVVLLQYAQELGLEEGVKLGIIRPEHVKHLGISKEGWIEKK